MTPLVYPFKFTLGQHVDHGGGRGWRAGCGIVISRGLVETETSTGAIYLVSYGGGEGGVYRVYMLEEELRAIEGDHPKDALP